MTLHYDIPIKTPSLANARGCWQKRYAMTKKQRSAAWLCTGVVVDRKLVPRRLRITLTRVTPPRGKRLDTDNLASALKAVRDGIADALGRDDGDGEIEWRYDQAKGAGWNVAVRLEGVRE